MPTGDRGKTWNLMSDPQASSRGFTPPETRRPWRDRVLPRIVIPLYWLYWLALLPAGLGRRHRTDATRVAIESGRIGWTHVYYEELWTSAAEYAGEDHLVRVVIDRDVPYLPQFRAWIRQQPLTHVILDPRTGVQTWPRALVDLLVMGWRLRRLSITPIVVLTDASVRRHRLQSAVLTAFGGVVVTFMDTAALRPMFPHRRVLGPMPMPVSVSRLEWLEVERARLGAASTPTVAFIGGVYPPRAEFLERLTAMLVEDGITLTVHGDKYATSNDDYWRVLVAADIVVTTTMQGVPRTDMDWVWIRQLVFRFTEALSAGAVVVGQEVPGAERFFVADRDYAQFVSLDEARATVRRVVRDVDERERLRRQGHATAASLAREHMVFRLVDEVLGDAAIRPN